MKKWKIEITKHYDYHTYINADTFQEAEEKAKDMMQANTIKENDFEYNEYYEIISKYRGDIK